MIVQQILRLIQGQVADSRCQIWKIMPHMTWDNYFSGCNILNWLGELGLGATVTCRRDRLPKEITDTYLHKKKTDSSPRPKAARYFNPIVAVKNVAAVDGKKGHQRVHTSFQSTSSCNISGVNALSSCNMSIRRRERGRGENKRYWGIEMNDARSLYLQSYYRIDCIDHLIQNARIFIEAGNIGTPQFYMAKGLQSWWHSTCTWSAVKANLMPNGKSRSRLTSGSSVRSFRNKCWITIHSNGFTQGIKT